MMKSFACLAAFGLVFFLLDLVPAQAGSIDAPVLTNYHYSGTSQGLVIPPYPAAEAYTIYASTNAGGPYTADPAFRLTAVTNVTIAGATLTTNISFEWRKTNAFASAEFYRGAVVPMSDSDLLASTVLNRLCYGPTPDELDRIHAMGAEAYLAEQIAPWSLAENAESVDPEIQRLGRKLVPLDTAITNAEAATLTDTTGLPATLPEYRAWHVLRAVSAKRQFLEILLQFFENHFVTEYGKSFTWFNNNYDRDLRRRLAARMEYAENQRWREALLNPQCTFLDLLKISAESPAMIIYLDTVRSDGRAGKIANENWPRELLELFSWGVDNGYNQDDITLMSSAWTGWRVDIVDPANALNPFAPRSRRYIYSGPGAVNSITNLYGAYAFNYQSAYHNSAAKTVFGGHVVPARFGLPWAGKPYSLTLANGTGTNGIQDGYQIIQHVANQPFAQEYISIKLCRLLVHDQFPNPTTSTNQPEYEYYDYTRSDLTAEAALVHACMMTWETNSPKGQIWKVIKTITDSKLFRGHSASRQKIKTPLEYLVSGVRALRASLNTNNPAGPFTSDTDGFAISGSNLMNPDADSPLQRMGRMLLFDRESPDGYPEDGPGWINGATLAERIRWVQSYCIASGRDGHRINLPYRINDAGNSTCQPVLLLQSRLAAGSWQDAGRVADYLLSILYPGEGTGNLQLYRQSAIDFLNTTDDGSPDPFSGLSPSSVAGSVYDTRVRGTVALLMSFQRFHEQ